MKDILEVAAAAGIEPGELEPRGRGAAKIPVPVVIGRRRRGRLVLVSGMTPTPAGEGKTTVTIGLAQGLRRMGVTAVPALRQPSQGPVFGRKGGGAGGGRARLEPYEAINLHLTGDLHAVTAANNLLAALIDNHIHWGEPPSIDPASVTWRRCLDVNDRTLRSVRVATASGCAIETGFQITAASEVMAILSLAEDYSDLRRRLGRIVVARDQGGVPVTAGALGAAGAMAVLLRDALAPNLVQTLEEGPAVVHGGPFGNIAHGCSSVLGTRLALSLGDVCLTEAGFGADLGAEKFCSIKARQSGLKPDAALVVATLRALRHHAGPRSEGRSALRRGLENLARHMENLASWGLPAAVLLNRFADDEPDDLKAAVRLCEGRGWPVAVVDAFALGGEGAASAGKLVLELLQRPARFRHVYPRSLALRDKIERLARKVYRAREVRYLPAAVEALARMEQEGAGELPVCMAKTQFSFSDDPELVGAPVGHVLTIRDARLSAGAGFVVAYAGKILTMPGLPRRPAASELDLLPDGTIRGRI